MEETEIQKQILAAIDENRVDQPGFYGVISFHFQNGRLTLIRREETTLLVGRGNSDREVTNSHERRRSS